MNIAVIDTHTGLVDPGLKRDADLERQIDAAYELMVKAKTDEESKDHWRVMVGLIGRRSQSQILRMELAKRLARKQAREAAQA